MPNGRNDYVCFESFYIMHFIFRNTLNYLRIAFYIL